MVQAWKAGRGKLGVLAPLIGLWRAEAESPMGPVVCEREFSRVLGDKYVQLDALWKFGPEQAGPKQDSGGGYRERAIYGADKDGVLSCWSFTSDGKRSEGRLADASDIHPRAVCFEARMDAGLARQIYWPDADDGIHWAVEARTKSGWRRFTQHLYLSIRAAGQSSGNKPGGNPPGRKKV
jgi:hypothetical protein